MRTSAHTKERLLQSSSQQRVLLNSAAWRRSKTVSPDGPDNPMPERPPLFHKRACARARVPGRAAVLRFIARCNELRQLAFYNRGGDTTAGLIGIDSPTFNSLPSPAIVSAFGRVSSVEEGGWVGRRRLTVCLVPLALRHRNVECPNERLPTEMSEP
jgi:hypothetical protein